MCGIFGFIVRPDSAIQISAVQPVLNALFMLSETRGKDAAGLALLETDQITILKYPQRASTVIRSAEYQSLFSHFGVRAADTPDAMGAMGHARMVTNGSEECSDNNQPVTKHGLVCLHNGIVVNDQALWHAFPSLQRQYEVDTEIILSLVWYYRQQGDSFPQAVNHTFQQIRGANSIALLANDLRALVLATTNGSLFFASSSTRTELVFASEKYILRQTLERTGLHQHFQNAAITQVMPGEGFIFSFDDLEPCRFALGAPETPACTLPLRQPAQRIHQLAAAVNGKHSRTSNGSRLLAGDFAANDRFVEQVNQAVKALRRCSRCLLPETFPFITFDDEGVCNYCHNYTPRTISGPEKLAEMAHHLRSADGSPDCLVPLSGGRDSCYGLHYIRNELNMNPVAYTYDWGMVTDLARRNISRMCGALGVEHILVSANIKKKRANIRRNVSAWLRRPDIGTVPLFMAGDKQFFYFANLLKKQMNLNMVFFSQNDLERTDFKSGFCGINESHQKQFYWNLSLVNKFRLAWYYGWQFLLNPAYLNRSLVDTAGGFISYYFIPRDFTLLYHYVPWDEKLFADTLIREYDWETASDTETTWRIGDGTAPFYNYIYYVMAGFTENDTFRSNQIREGLLTRAEAMRLVEAENQPRYESMQWYCATIGIDLHSALQVINAAPRRYQL